MKFQSFRSSLMGGLLALLAAITLVSCGGGGAASAPNNPGAVLTLLPALPTVYAGVPTQFTVTGGRGPYKLAVNEPILVIPPTTNGSFTAVPFNPGVIDAGLPPESLPFRSINLSAQDANGDIVTMVVKVAQNFLTGYGVSFRNTVCPTGVASAAVCAGGETVVTFSAVSNGALHGNQAFSFTAVKGNFLFVQPDGTLTSSINVQSDHEGTVIAVIRVPPGTPTQVAILRLTETSSRVSTDTPFIISGGTGTASLTAIPNTFTFLGADTTQCGNGSGDFLIFDGTPPYTAISSSPLVTVTPSVSGLQPGRFTFVTNAPRTVPCAGAMPIVVTDANGVRVTVTVNSNAGTVTPAPPPAFAVQPTAVTIPCQSSGSVLVAGGTGNYSATSSNPVQLQALVAGNTVQIARLADPPPGPNNFPSTMRVAVSDGVSIIPVVVTITGGIGGTGTDCR